MPWTTGRNGASARSMPSSVSAPCNMARRKPVLFERKRFPQCGAYLTFALLVFTILAPVEAAWFSRGATVNEACSS